MLLYKALGLIATPLGVALGAGLLALPALRRRGRGLAAGLLGFSLLWLWAWSLPVTAQVIMRSLTTRYPPQRAETLPEADAIVLLGGSVVPAWNGNGAPYPDLRESADRVWHAARLYHAGKAPLIIVSAGNVWDAPGRQSESDATRMVLAAFGVPESSVVSERSSRTTRGNAAYSAEIAASRGLETVLVVTSAWHMHRTLATFRRAGLQALAAPTDHGSKGAQPLLLRILPSSWALRQSTKAFREHLGLLVYRLRGWA